MSPSRIQRWQIFCRAVDNFGDIAVCWRLARVLAMEHACQVFLVVDRPDLLEFIAPRWRDYRKTPNGGAIRVVRWTSTSVFSPEVNVVIEAFACELPRKFFAAMRSGARPPLWINLEYLSAEDWISGCHCLPSPHPHTGADKFFFFPGFVDNSGGLLREAGLIARRAVFQASPKMQGQLWASVGLQPPNEGERRASLFCYENPAIGSLLDRLASGERPWTLVVPEGRSLPSVATWFGASSAQAGDEWQRGRLRVRVVPFSDQDAYDQLLWACDLNLVRGEDSLVRALWSARPLLWQIYPQQAEAHLVKLEAFLARIAGDCSNIAATSALGAMMRSWNTAQDIGRQWDDFEHHFDAIASIFANWSEHLAAGPELATSLVHFAETQLK